MTRFQKGDRVDWHDLRGGEVLRVGLASIWASFHSALGQHTVVAPHEEFRAAGSLASLAIGAFLLRPSTLHPGRVQIHWRITGEMLETDTAKLESALEKFWRKEF